MSEVPSARYGTRIDATTWHGHLAASGLLGTDPESRRQRWLAKTVHGSKRFANKQLEELLEEAGRGRLRAGRVSDLLERWFGVASPGWAVSTASHTRSVIDCYLRPYFGHLRVGKITTEDIDDFYGYLLRWGGNRGQPLAPGTVARVHGVGLRSGRSVGVGFREPCFGRHAPRVQPAEIRPPNPTQVGVLLGWARQRKPSLFCYLRLVACTGARRSRRQPFAKQRSLSQRDAAAPGVRLFLRVRPI